MKKFLIGFLLLFSIFSTPVSAQLDWSDLDPFNKNGAVGQGTGGIDGINDSIGNYLGGVGEDVTTDLFGNTGIGPIPDGEFILPCPDEFNTIGQNTSAREFILNVLNFFLSFLGIIAVAALIYAGFLYVTDGGDGSNSEKSKKIILYALIGILIVLGSFAIVNTVIKNAVSGGNDSTSDVNITGQFAGDADLIERCKKGKGIAQNIIVWDIDESQPSVVKNLNNLTVVKNGEEVQYELKINPGLNSAGETFTITPKLVLWNFGNGWVDSGGQLSMKNTYYNDGQETIGVIITDTENKKYRLSRRVLVGNGVNAKFYATSFFPVSGDDIRFDGTPSTALVGTIQKYEWSTKQVSGTGTCPSLNENRPTTSAEFFGDGLVCEVTLKVTTNYPEIYDTYTEEIEVDGGDETPKPNIETVLVEQDPNNDDEDHIFKVKVWASDKIDMPLEFFQYEVWEAGTRLMTKTTTFGTDPNVSNSGTSGNQPPNGYRQTYSEMMLDLSNYPGDRNLVFRVITRNSYGNDAQSDREKKNYIISPPANLNKKTLDFSLPANIKIGQSYTPQVTPNNLLDNTIYNFDWAINGNSVSTGKQPNLLFNNTGMQTVTLTVSPKQGQNINFVPLHGWSVSRNTFVTSAENDLPYEKIDFTLPAQIELNGSYTPNVSPLTELDDNLYEYKWLINNTEVSYQKSPTLNFTSAGIKTVTFHVKVKSGQTPTFQPINGWSVSKNIFVGQDNPSFPYKRIDFGIAGSASIGDSISPLISPDALLNEDIYNFIWKLNGKEVDTNKLPTIAFSTAGINTVSVEISVKAGESATFQPVDGWLVSKNIFINSQSNKALDYHNIDFTLPAQIDTGGSFTPTVSPATVLDETIYDFSWEINGAEIATTKTPNIIFSSSGLKKVKLSVFLKSGKVQTFNPVNGWSVSKNIFVGQDDPTFPYKRVDFTLPATLAPNTNFTPIVSPNNFLTEDIYDFSWEINGTNFSDRKQAELTFPQIGLNIVTLTASVKNGENANFKPVDGLTVTKGIFIKTSDTLTPEERAKKAALPYHTIDFTLPPQIDVNGEYTPTISPNDTLDENIYDFSWKIGTTEISNEKNPTFLFENPGLQKVTLSISTKTGETATFNPTASWTLSKNIFVGEDNPLFPYKRVDFTLPSALSLGESFSPIPEPDDFLTDETYNFTWKLGGKEISTEKYPRITFETGGINTLSLNISLKDGKSATFKPVDGWSNNRNIYIGTSNNNPPVIYKIPVSPGNTGNTDTIFGFYPLVSDPDGDALTYNWDLGDGIKMNVKNIAHRYAKAGNYTATLTVSDGLETVSSSVDFTIVQVGQAIPPSTIDVYARNEDSDLTAGDIGIKNKAEYVKKLNDLKEKRTGIIERLDGLKAKKAELEKELKKLNDPAYVNELVNEQKNKNPLFLQKMAELAAEKDPIKREQLKKEIQAIEDQIEYNVKQDLKQRKEELRIEIFKVDSDIAAAELELQEVNKQIKELEKFLGEDFVIEGTKDTTFFLYGTLPLESARAILIEWKAGDGRSKLGQNVWFKYSQPGIYKVQMVVTDGINTVSDNLKIKINPKRPQPTRK